MNAVKERNIKDYVEGNESPHPGFIIKPSVIIV